MHLSSLHLRDFRNYRELSLQFSPGLNVIHGDNAQGKTNLLEAIYLLATGRSHRTNRDVELVFHGSASLAAKATVERRTGTLFLELSLGLETRKELKINGMQERRIASLVGSLAAVLFSPDDLQLLKGPPAGRRRFLDVELSQLSQTYLQHLITYNKVLSQRNSLLKSPAPDTNLLSVYDEQLITTGAQLVVRRAGAVRRLAPIAQRYHSSLSDDKEDLRLDYQSQGATPNESPSLATVEQRLSSQLQQRRSEEIRRQVTLVGPHRDDLGFWIDDKDTRVFASQGQQRTTVLALKLAELQFMTEELGEAPVLLLDDVSSELDPHRRHYLLSAVQGGVQTFISCTDLEDLMVRTWPQENRLFRVRAGTIDLEERGLA